LPLSNLNNPSSSLFNSISPIFSFTIAFFQSKLNFFNCSLYIYTLPFSFLAALHMICIREDSLLRNHCLSASSIHILLTSGKSRPSLSRFTHTITSILPSLSSLSISSLSIVSISLCKYFTFTQFSSKKSVSSSLDLFVIVVISSLWFLSTTSDIFFIISSTINSIDL
ncbi:MAG: hypothetical protein P1U46_04650, partial [Patescibacteria group bacterium]|nr:hypothetical protein [Patescibacteria group bacterium]